MTLEEFKELKVGDKVRVTKDEKKLRDINKISNTTVRGEIVTIAYIYDDWCLIEEAAFCIGHECLDLLEHKRS